MRYYKLTLCSIAKLLCPCESHPNNYYHCRTCISKAPLAVQVPNAPYTQILKADGGVKFKNFHRRSQSAPFFMLFQMFPQTTKEVFKTQNGKDCRRQHEQNRHDGVAGHDVASSRVRGPIGLYRDNHVDKVGDASEKDADRHAHVYTVLDLAEPYRHAGGNDSDSEKHHADDELGAPASKLGDAVEDFKADYEVNHDFCEHDKDLRFMNFSLTAPGVMVNLALFLFPPLCAHTW